MAANPPTHLIIICCHAIYEPPSPSSSHLSPESWHLQPYQPVSEIPTFIQHMKSALTLLASSPSSLLVISGASTDTSTPLSESASYFNLLTSQKYFGLIDPEHHPSLYWRIILEKRALDSFGNLVFSMIEFWKRVGRWPERVSVVSHEFKKGRFMECHLKALGFPLEKVDFVGVDPSYMVPENPDYDEKAAEEVKKGELERGFKPWAADRFGKGEALRQKRHARNSWNANQLFFDNDEQRKRSGIKSEVISWTDSKGVKVQEEILLDAPQPWS